MMTFTAGCTTPFHDTQTTSSKQPIQQISVELLNVVVNLLSQNILASNFMKSWSQVPGNMTSHATLMLQYAI